MVTGTSEKYMCTYIVWKNNTMTIIIGKTIAVHPRQVEMFCFESRQNHHYLNALSDPFRPTSAWLWIFQFLHELNKTKLLGTVLSLLPTHHFIFSTHSLATSLCSATMIFPWWLDRDPRDLFVPIIDGWRDMIYMADHLTLVSKRHLQTTLLSYTYGKSLWAYKKGTLKCNSPGLF